MNLDLVIAGLRQRCPIFSGRVAGAAQFQLLPEKTNLPVPCAYVIPLDDSPEDNRSATGYRQSVTDSFAVIVALSNVADERGQVAAGNVHAIRRELFKALLGLLKKILGRHHGGIYKRIDENRELLELLQREAPELLAKQPWVVSWLESQDGFLRDLESAVPLTDVQFQKQACFPRPWPLTVFRQV